MMNADNRIKLNKIGVIKSLGLTILGIVLFLVKLPFLNDSVFNYLVSFFQSVIAPFSEWVLFVFIAFSWVGTVLGTCVKHPIIKKYPLLKKTFFGKKMQLVTLTVALIVVTSYIFLPLEFLNRESASLMGMCANMVVFMIIAKLILPLLSDYGLSELLEVYLRPVMKPLLKVPGSAVVSLLTCMFVSVTVAVVMVADQFKKAVYNRKEAVIIISCMTIPSMPFAMLALSNVGLIDRFGTFYLYLGMVCLLVSVITVRFFPVRRIKETYESENGEISAEMIPSGEPKWKRALDGASKKALAARYHPIDNVIGITLNMISFIPSILAWGTIMKVILANTNIINILLYPYAMWLKLFGIAEGFEISPVLILNMIDVVLSTVLLAELNNAETVLKILCMMMGQMVYMAPLLIALACEGLTNMKEQMGIWFVRIVLLVPAAVLLYPVFF